MTQLIVTLGENIAKVTGRPGAYAERAAAAAMQIKGRGMRCFLTLREGEGDGGSARIGTMIDGRAKTAAGGVAEADIPFTRKVGAAGALTEIRKPNRPS